MCKVYTGYCGTSEIEHLLAKARGLSLRTGAQTMLYLSLGELKIRVVHFVLKKLLTNFEILIDRMLYIV